MLRVGIAGWDYPDWEGIVYPPQPSKGFDRLTFLAEFLDVVELNVTFYRQPDASAAGSWARRVGPYPAFRFTAKLYRGLTHGEPMVTADTPALVPPAKPKSTRRRTRGPDPASLVDEAAQYREGIAPLLEAGRLGAVLAQFPHSFHDNETSRRHLERLVGLLDKLPLVAEFRHRSWDHEEALRFLHGLGIGFCNIDQPQVGATLRPTGHVTSPVAYIRLHGRNAENWFKPESNRYDYLYSIEELRPWAERAERLSERAEEVFVIANNHYRGKAPANALMLKALLSRARVPAPPDLARAYRDLGKLALEKRRSQPQQGRLFD